VHLADWIYSNQAGIHERLETKMTEVRKAIEKTHAARKTAALKTRQPLAKLTISSPLESPKENLLQVIADEVNVKTVEWVDGDQLSIELDTVVTPKLEAEGNARELIRQIQDARKAMGTGINDLIEVTAPDWPAAFEDEIKEKVKAVLLTKGSELEIKPCTKT
jgi:isoleucyl-tRNA synthetase